MKARLFSLIEALAVVAAVNSAAAVEITRGPYVQLGASTAMTVRWRTDNATDSRVQFGTAAGSLTSAASQPSLTTEHEVRLTGLAPGARYFYSVGSSSQVLASGAEFHFFTAPATGVPQPTRVWVLGDSGTANANAAAVRNGHASFTGARRTDVILMLGDNAYDDGTDAEFQAAVFDMYPAFLRSTPLWPAIGNHDVPSNPPPTAPYFQMFTLPTQAEAGGTASGTEKYYSFDHANVHFVSIDTEASSVQPGSPQITWLQQDLAATAQRWIVAYSHHPPYTRGGFNSDTDAELKTMREKLVPVLEAGGVDLFFTGHAHSYERSVLLDGHYGAAATLTEEMKKDGGDGRVSGTGAYGKDPGANNGAVYVVAGSSGKLGSGPLNHPIMAESLLVLGSVALDFTGDEMRAQFVDKDGAVRDEFSISKAPLVTLAAAAPSSEAGPVAGAVTLTRTRELGSALTVNLSVGGSATAGSDYAALPAQATFPAGAGSVSIAITPIADALAEGAETVVITAANGTGYRLSSATKQAIATIADRPSDQWRFAEFGANANNAAVAGDAADPDRDGRVNLLERAFGTEPLVFSPPLAASVVGGFLALTFPRAAIASDLTFTVQFSQDLQTWQNGSVYRGTTTPAANAITTQVSRLPGDPEVITVRSNVPLAGDARQFLRLHLSSP